MASFQRSDAAVIATFEDEEASVLNHLLVEMVDVVGSGSARSDPISQRLFPRAYEDDEDQSAYVELIGDQLQQTKLKVVEEVRSSLASGDGRVEMGPDLLESWLVVLTDIRVALGTRLEVTEETMSAELDPEDPDAAALSVLHWLGWVQESLLREAGTSDDQERR